MRRLFGPILDFLIAIVFILVLLLFKLPFLLAWLWDLLLP